MKTETVQFEVVEYFDLEAFIREVYAIDDPKEDFSIIAMEEWGNDSQHAYQGMKADSLNKWDQRDLDKWKADPLGYHPFRLYLILQDMVNNGHLKAGNYLVTVCW